MDLRPARLPLLALLLLTLLLCPASARDRGADGHYEKRTSSHFVLYQDVDIDETAGLRGSRRFEQQVLSVLESAHREVDEYLGMRPDRPITVVVYDPQIYDAEFSGLFRFPAAGFYGGRVHIRGDTVVTNKLVRVLHHELVHAAFDAEAPSLVLPAWLNEGTAEWLEARLRGQRRLTPHQRAFLARLAEQGQLFTLEQLSTPSFAKLGPKGAQVAYLQSYAFIAHLVIVHGDQSLRELINAYVRSGNLERAVRRTYRADLATLEAQMQAELLGTGR
jgi:hypothetical protein